MAAEENITNAAALASGGRNSWRGRGPAPRHNLLFARDDEIGNPEEGALDFRVGEAADGVASFVGKLGGAGEGGVQRSVAGKDPQNLLVGGAAESALVEHGLDVLAFAGSAALQGVDDGHGHLAFAEIAAHGFAE